jgi:YD repeat-containing protein
MDIQYVYSATQNNGRVTQTVDNVLGETVNYTYDSLLRLTGAQATGGQWGQTYTFDGFGNLTAKTVTAAICEAAAGIQFSTVSVLGPKM